MIMIINNVEENVIINHYDGKGDDDNDDNDDDGPNWK